MSSTTLCRHLSRCQYGTSLSPRYTLRSFATHTSQRPPPPPPPKPSKSQPGRPQTEQQTGKPPPKSWLTRQVETSPVVRKLFFAVANVLGYRSPKQTAGRRGLVLYEHVCAVTPDEGKQFWQEECFLPPTFQSWFTITNLHVWMLTVRLRALPKPLGDHHTQALIDHFFLDVEDRVRDVLQPRATPAKPYTFRSDFYINSNMPKSVEMKSEEERKKLVERVRVPDRIVTRQMKIFKEQWAGMGMSFDLALVKNDMEMASAVWRNILGARGAQGIDYSSSSSSDPSSPQFRRAINLVGGEVESVSKISEKLSQEEAKDDGSGVHDFPPSEADKYLTFPERMLDIVAYVRREVKRLEGLSDRDIMFGDASREGGGWEKVKFGKVEKVKVD